MKKNDAKQPISISMSISLASILSEYCFKHDLPVSCAVSTAVKRFLAAEMATTDPEFWNSLTDKRSPDKL